ncbi:MAG: hypothetical protein DCC71_20495 [Proteobacteria bacterium]|nr:MAG: hypothetical protein DCC71_20495 [Pseudomonadota bacterium]
MLALAAWPAQAQLGGSLSASGDVSVLYRLPGSGTVYGANAATIGSLPFDAIVASIEIGDSGLIANQDTGSLSIAGVGDAQTPRDLGDVDVKVGDLDVNGSFLTGRITLGVAVQSQFTDPSAGNLSVLLSDIDDIVVLNGLLTAQVSSIAATVRENGRALISGCTGSIGSTIGAEVEIDASTLSSAGFRGAQVVKNSTVTGSQGSFREGVFDVEATSVDVQNDLSVGGNTTSAPPTDTDLVMTSSVFESGTALVRSGAGLATNLEMRGASTWRSFGLFTILNETTQVDINSGSRIDARADFRSASAAVTVRSTTGSSARIDVAGDFDLDGSSASALTIEDGGVVDVDGTLTIGPLATLNLNGGTLRVGVLDEQGVLNENGGTLIVPEAAGSAPPFAAALTLALLRRRRD